MTEYVEIIDVSPRDGLQNEPRPVSTEEKLKLIEKLVEARVPSIQATSFVHPKWVPQMAAAEQVSAGLAKFSGVAFSALILNFKGYERALAAGFRKMDFSLPASDKFNRQNANRSVAESLKLFEQIARAAERDGIALRAGISASFHCPFEGRIPVSTVVTRVRQAREVCLCRIGLSDTDGMAFPDQVKEAIAAVCEEVKLSPGEMVLHFHDTYGRALSNAYAGLEAGVRTFDASVGGLGGCPYCPGASGNVATEDLVALVEGLGYTTGIIMDKLLDAAELAIHYSSRPYEGHALRASRPGAVYGGS
ncbi:MAG TPA: hydroxymethylglutaryl-CoA lyase [Terriglobia bacterium]|nr:hydroxymethylglutaryl-CoA lyase [Terriglobia bacterium]